VTRPREILTRRRALASFGALAGLTGMGVRIIEDHDVCGRRAHAAGHGVVAEPTTG